MSFISQRIHQFISSKIMEGGVRILELFKICERVHAERKGQKPVKLKRAQMSAFPRMGIPLSFSVDLRCS